MSYNCKPRKFRNHANRYKSYALRLNLNSLMYMHTNKLSYTLAIATQKVDNLGYHRREKGSTAKSNSQRTAGERETSDTLFWISFMKFLPAAVIGLSPFHVAVPPASTQDYALIKFRWCVFCVRFWARKMFFKSAICGIQFAL